MIAGCATQNGVRLNHDVSEAQVRKAEEVPGEGTILTLKESGSKVKTPLCLETVRHLLEAAAEAGHIFALNGDDNSFVRANFMPPEGTHPSRGRNTRHIGVLRNLVGLASRAPFRLSNYF